MNLNNLIKDRWSPRAFSNRKVEEEKILSIFEAARWAPSSMNEQPWKFVYVVQNEEGYDEVFSSLLDGNKPWAKEAPVLIVGMAKLNFDYKDRPNFHHLYDLGQAVGALTHQATHVGLHLHQMGGVNFDALRTRLKISEDFVPAVVIAVGYIGDAKQLPEPFISKESALRVRKSLSEIVTKGSFKD